MLEDERPRYKYIGEDCIILMLESRLRVHTMMAIETKRSNLRRECPEIHTNRPQWYHLQRNQHKMLPGSIAPCHSVFLRFLLFSSRPTLWVSSFDIAFHILFISARVSSYSWNSRFAVSSASSSCCRNFSWRASWRSYPFCCRAASRSSSGYRSTFDVVVLGSSSGG